MYAGLLSFLTGFAVWTASIDRLLMVVLLLVVLDIKSDYEEGELMNVYPEYVEYKGKVQSKFLPQAFFNLRRETKEQKDERY